MKNSSINGRRDMAALDETFVLRNATVIDGTGAAGTSADVVVSGDRILAVGDVRDETLEAVDLNGLVLAPGFIDIHTHLDAQLLWDPDLTPSSWHGVTSVVVGNCGFSIAPTRPADREAIIGLLENVEDIPGDALRAGIRWEYDTFPSYLDLADRLPKRLNVAALIGHSPLRLYALGQQGAERPADTDQVSTMYRIVREALDAGAIGFATSVSESHLGHRGRPVPSRNAELQELLRLIDAVGDAGEGIVQISAGDAGVDGIATLLRHTRSRTTWTSLLTGRFQESTRDTVDKSARISALTWPQISCRPVVIQMTLLEPRAVGNLAVFAEILSLPRGKRIDRYTSSEWYGRAAAEIAHRWGNRLDVVAVDVSPTQPWLEGRLLGDLAAECGSTALQTMIEIAATDELQTRFTVPLLNDDEEGVAELLQDPRTLIGLSDAGAHVNQLCDACYSTHLLGTWVRDRQAITLESAVWRLTGQPAEVFGIKQRGRIEPGYFADLVAFDADVVGPGQRTRARDLPTNAERLLVRSEGIAHVWVNGKRIVSDGSATKGAHPGRVLRGG
jgi:N-acyl-D-amino-acid deacylase